MSSRHLDPSKIDLTYGTLEGVPAIPHPAKTKKHPLKEALDRARADLLLLKDKSREALKNDGVIDPSAAQDSLPYSTDPLNLEVFIASSTGQARELEELYPDLAQATFALPLSEEKAYWLLEHAFNVEGAGLMQEVDKTDPLCQRGFVGQKIYEWSYKSILRLASDSAKRNSTGYFNMDDARYLARLIIKNHLKHEQVKG